MLRNINPPESSFDPNFLPIFFHPLFVFFSITSMKGEKLNTWSDIVEKSIHKKEFENNDNKDGIKASEELTSLINENRDVLMMLQNHRPENSWKKLQQQLNHGNNLFHVIMRYAAIIVITFLSGVFMNHYFSGKSTEEGLYSFVDVPFGQMSNITLPDGTEINLNSGSTLKYPVFFDKNKREVYFSGEGYFHVSGNKEQPFFVHLDDYTVKVTGTEFNVQSYPGLPVETALIEGKVSILNKKGKQLVELKPSQLAQYIQKEHKIKLKKIDPVNYTQWKEGKLFFNNETLGDISKKLEKWYNVEIQYLDDTIKNKRLTGTILKYKPLDQIIKILTLKEALNYEIKIRADKPDLVIFSLKS